MGRWTETVNESYGFLFLGLLLKETLDLLSVTKPITTVYDTQDGRGSLPPSSPTNPKTSDPRT